ncbi:nucleotidyltransferase family protein [Novosphingobium sp. Gsoil 351]|uniref:nucleotidyltransferase family protein n=1 Tax=Novosphingobium sp. Gsoil 351 TaxID=2675225 RepID=UPI0012B4B143|nr:nucleotidyltransferase family protein [Novosphingobium sp. Gsoil 351]QGN55549.1 NTP transferase domain-containing protein [Novosphingobium sp. Gsoil 351]
MPHALVLAGSRPGAVDPVAAAEGVSHKALVDVGGMPMLARVLHALRAAGIEHIAVSADAPEVLSLAYALSAIPVQPGSGPSASVATGFATMGPPLLVTTADHALLRPEWITDFVADTPPDADVAVLLARRALVEAALPGTRRTWLRFADGAWSGCNLFLLNTSKAEAAIETWKAVEAERKQPWKIAARLGAGTLLSYLGGRLTLAEAIARLGRKVGVEAAVVAARDGLAAVDVDKPGDLVQVRQILGGGV